jgi:hypothetical protein
MAPHLLYAYCRDNMSHKERATFDVHFGQNPCTDRDENSLEKEQTA